MITHTHPALLSSSAGIFPTLKLSKSLQYKMLKTDFKLYYRRFNTGKVRRRKIISLQTFSVH